MTVQDITQGEQVITESFPVTGMSCAACATSVESILSNTEGVDEASVNFASNTVLVKHRVDVSSLQLQEALRKVGYDLVIDVEDPDARLEEEQLLSYRRMRLRLIWSAVLTLPVFILGMFYPDWSPGRWIALGLSIPVLFYFGRSFYISAWKQTRHGRANMDTLVALSTGIAFGISLFNTLAPRFWTSRGFDAHVYYETAAVIITFISLGKLLEERAKANTSSALKKLIGLQPNTVTVIREEEESEIPISEVMAGDRLIARPGEKIAVDGRVVAGESFLDESLITGESMPSRKSAGSTVYAGTINQKGSLQYSAEKVGSATLLGQIINTVKQAQGSKAPVQRLVDKIAAVFVPTVLGIAVLTFIIWLIFGGSDAMGHALYTAIAVLVIACPCALGLATPTAVMVGIGKGAEHNILIRDAESLELAHKVNTIILDKTGTITRGRPVVTNIHWIDNTSDADASELLALELNSEHPVAAALCLHLKEKGIKAAELSSFRSITGKGVLAENKSGDLISVGNLQFLQDQHIPVDNDLSKLSSEWQIEAKTVIFFCRNKEVLAVIAVADDLKQESAGAIRELSQMGIKVEMLTGDNEETARAISQATGIQNYRSAVTPHDKAVHIQNLQKSGQVVAMVGDGINDSEALAVADVSIAMGHGSDIAMDVAKMTLVSSNLALLPGAIRLSRSTVRGIRQNLFWAFIYNLIGIPIAAGVLYPVNGFLLDPMLAGAAMAFSSVSVVANSLRLRRIKL